MPSRGDAGRRQHARSNQRRLAFVLIFGGVILVAEVIGGVLANSLVLLSDAAHMSTDLAAVALAWFAIRLSLRPPDAHRTYGYYRAETLAAFINAIVLWALCGWLLWEAWSRLQAPPAVDGGIVAAVGTLGLVANVVMAAAIHRGSKESLNVRSAYVHILSDTLGSLAAVVTGLAIYFYGLTWMDPATTIFVAVLILVWTWRLTRDTLHILLEGTPATLSRDEVRHTIEETPGVASVHDLHLWSLTTGVDNLSAHVRVVDPTKGPDVVRAIRERLQDAHMLHHVTIEVEHDDADCLSCD